MTRIGWIAVGVSSAITLVLALVLVVALAGGDADDRPDVAGSPTLAAPDSEDMQELQECLAEHGVELPEPGEAPSGELPDQEALEACSEYMPDPQFAPNGGAAPQGVPFQGAPPGG